MRDDRLDDGEEFFRDEQGLRPAVVQDDLVALRGQQRVERRRHDSGLEAAPEDDREFDRIEYDHRGPVLSLKSMRRIEPGQPAGLMSKFAVSEGGAVFGKSDSIGRCAGGVTIDEIKRGVAV